ncbi:MAG: zinc ribbon domain-containing protein [Desulfobacterales bacterium]
MPVYHFICKKHGGFEKITIRAEWDNIRCPKCGAISKVDQKCDSEHKQSIRNIEIAPALH